VSKEDVIERLEMLLERVRARAAEPRRTRGEIDEKNGDDTEVTVDLVVAAAAQRPPVESPLEEKRDGRDSRERLVAAEPTATEQPIAVQAAAPTRESVPPIDVTEVEVIDEQEEEEEAPISSRRTVASEPQERLAQMAFGGDEPPQPLHTPPPESGRLPAATSSDFDADITGVRNATPMVPRRTEESLPRALVPEVTRPKLASSDAVAELIGEAQRFAPSTFVALLDASLLL
jgi:hypothetical protein